MQIPITREQAENIRTRDNMVHEWLRAHKTNSYNPEELSAELGITLPTNEERSNLEVFDFLADPPERYFLYINESERTATTWTGQRLGAVSFASAHRSNFGDIRVNITVVAINGRVYHGTYYKGSGDYARVKAAKR